MNKSPSWFSGMCAIALCAAAASAQTWTALGPGPITGGQVEGMTAQSSPVNGCVKAIIAHPTSADTIYIAAVNGGIWKTTNATAATPVWTPLTDAQTSLGMGALQFDVTDATRQTVLAGIGRFSSFGNTSVPQTGLLRTTNGGTTWATLGTVDLSGRNISGVAARGAILLAAANSATTGSAGLYRSTNTGATFTLISGGSGLPAGGITDLVADPGNNARFYVGVLGTSVGIYRSDDTGATWTTVTGTIAVSSTTTDNIKLAVHSNTGAGTNAVYAAIDTSGRLGAVYRSANAGGVWTVMDLPQTFENTANVGIHPGGQGNLHLCLLADPTTSTVVFIGGDRQPTSNNDTGNFPNSIGAQNYTGRLFRGDSSLASGSQWRPLTHSGTSNNSAPHADSRAMVFDAAGNIIHSNDGGIYKRTLPNSTTGVWTSIGANLQIAEFHSAVWDRNTRTALGGTQDNGTNEETATAGVPWRQVVGGDGGKVAVEITSATVSQRYVSSQFLGGLTRRTMNTSNALTSSHAPTLVVNGTGGMNIYQIDSAQFYTPIYVNTQTPTKLLILMAANVFESSDRGDTLTNLGATGGTPICAAYGGRRQGVPNDAVLYVGGSTGVLRLRTTAGGPLNVLAAYPGGTTTIRAIAVDPDDWMIAAVVDSTRIFLTRNAGATWTNITGSFVDAALRTVEFAPNTPNGDTILVGGNNGVYSTSESSPGAWTELAPNLPNAGVREMHLDPVDRTLIAAVLGRGVWKAVVPRGCVADVDDGSGTGVGDGGVTIDDLLFYLNIFALGDARADVDDGSGTGTHDGGVTIDDLLFFLARFAAGC